ncbi:MAG: hypothetical protein NC548_26945 [Lachnospiraceae bacterium]|nr:hypothetical protein [Lachnospiraceae bacterium]
MPVLVYGSGGGGSAGYKYPLGDVISPELEMPSNNQVNLKWGDPEDTNSSEWKGTIVVAKKDFPPQGIEDGIRIAEITVRNQHKNTALITDVGGVGYYYGIFPYTKDYVVNNRRENVKCADGGLLKYTSWTDIISSAENGIAASKWKVGDEKKIIFSGGGIKENTRFVLPDLTMMNCQTGAEKPESLSR